MVYRMSPEPAPERATLGAFAPLFPVRDLPAALEHYVQLGFTVEPHDEDTEYAFVRRDNARLHLSYTPDHDPKTGAACVYLECSDVDALAREWRSAATGGRTGEPRDKEYQVREAAHVDLDSNMILIGTRIEPSPATGG